MLEYWDGRLGNKCLGDLKRDSHSLGTDLPIYVEAGDGMLSCSKRGSVRCSVSGRPCPGASSHLRVRLLQPRTPSTVSLHNARDLLSGRRPIYGGLGRKSLSGGKDWTCWDEERRQMAPIHRHSVDLIRQTYSTLCSCRPENVH